MDLKLPSSQLGPIKQPNFPNMGRTASNLDIDLGVYFPRPIPQIEVETFGSQNSPLINQDIVLTGSAATGVTFNQVTQNSILDFGGAAVISPVISGEASNSMRYQGYDVIDGGFDGHY